MAETEAQEPVAPKRPRYGPFMDADGNVFCEECHKLMDPEADKYAPWEEIHFHGGVKIEVWHEGCNANRIHRLDL